MGTGFFILFVFIPIFLSCASIFGLTYILASFYLNVRSRRWAKATGRLQLVEVKEARSSDGMGSAYSPNLAYSYSVGGKNYESKKYTFCMSSHPNKNISNDICSKLSQDVNLTVYYVPNSPQIALIDPSVNSLNLRTLRYAICVFVIFSPAHYIFYQYAFS